MQINGLDHYNIAAPVALVEQVRHFYCDLLGLTCGHRPAFNSDGYGLYAGERPLVHLKIIPSTPGDSAA
jgi:catechol 2,3-dioxygenase-like lactoylglutathione lyase family enzyme